MATPTRPAYVGLNSGNFQHEMPKIACREAGVYFYRERGSVRGVDAAGMLQTLQNHNSTLKLKKTNRHHYINLF